MTFTRSLLINLRSKPLGTIGLAIVLIIGLVGLFSPWIARYPYEEQHYDATKAASSVEYYFGTDQFGRDIFPESLRAPGFH